MRRKLPGPALSVAIILIVAAGIGMQSESVGWRTSVVAHKLFGGLESISWRELLSFMSPGSEIYVGSLAESPNPYAAIRNPYSSPDDVEAGRRIFGSRCMHCHGPLGAGSTGPNIATAPLSRGESDWAVYRTITDGLDGTAMTASELSDTERWQATAYVMSLRAYGGQARESARDRIAPIDLSYDRIRRSVSEPHNWLTYSNTYDGQRHSYLTGINRQSVERLTLRWVMQTGASDPIEASPIVIDGTMFLSLPEGRVVAVDGTTGEEIWRHQSRTPKDLPVCCGRVNRGVAVLHDRVFVATLDNRLQSLSVTTGELLWEKRVADPADGYSMTAAPLAVDGKIIVGVSGGEYGIRGFLDAYAAGTGERLWRFHTVPRPGEPGAETWAGESWRTGGGPTWVTGSYDPVLNTLYWGVGNPSPDFDGSNRAGDNLYTNSVVALDAGTGKLRWHFQFTPHDLHDFDANQVPVLVDTDDSDNRRLMYCANRNGFFYKLNRETGEYLGSLPFAKQSWAEYIDDNGRPVRRPEAIPSPQGTIVWPGSSGATNWPPPSFNPATGYFYVVRLNRPSIFFNVEAATPRESGKRWLGSALTAVPDSSETSLVAIDPDEMSIVWETPLPNIGLRGQMTGVMTTTELAFVGDSEAMTVYDAETGEELWRSRLGGPVGSPPVTFAASGVQYVVIAAGKNIYGFGVDYELDR